MPHVGVGAAEARRVRPMLKHAVCGDWHCWSKPCVAFGYAMWPLGTGGASHVWLLAKPMWLLALLEQATCGREALLEQDLCGFGQVHGCEKA